MCEQWGICVFIRSAASLMSHDSSFAHLLAREALIEVRQEYKI